MPQIFISYSRHSQEIVKTMAQDVEGIGHQVLFDQELTGGHVWWDQLLSQIRNCDLFVFALAPESLDSEACKREYTYAYNLKKTILPVLVADGVSPNLLPSALSSIQFVDYRGQDRQAAFALIRALSNLPLPLPLPDPLPEPPEVPVSYLGGLSEQVSAPTLTFQEQTALVLQLKDRMHDIREVNDARTLLQRLRNREDLFARVLEEIDTVLQSDVGAALEVADEPNSTPITGGKVQADPAPLPDPAPPRSDQTPQVSPQAGNVRAFRGKAEFASEVVAVVERSLMSKELQTQVVELESETIVQGQQKPSMLRKALGMDQAITVNIVTDGNDLKVTVGGAKWMDKAVGVGVGMLVFAPILLTAGWGAYKQKQLFDEVGSEIARYLESRP